MIKGSNELFISNGVVSFPQIKGWSGFPQVSGYISQPHLYTGAIFLTCRHFFTQHFALGVTTGFDHEGGQLSYGNSDLNTTFYNGQSGVYNVRAYTLAVEALLVYSKSSKRIIYGYLGTGVTYFSDKCTVYTSTITLPFQLPTNPYTYNHTFFDAQVTPFGIRFGDKIAGFFELGFGYKGIISGGLSVRL